MLFNLIGFNIAWFGLILIGNPFIAVAIIWLCCHLAFVSNKKAELALVFSIAAIGVFIDALLTYLGVFNFSSTSLFPIPFWLIALWLCFGATVGHSLTFFAGSTLLQLFVGGVFAPLSYLAAHGFNVVTFGYSLPVTYAILALIWAPLMVLCFRLHRYFCVFFNCTVHNQQHKKHHKPLISLLFIGLFTLPNSTLFNVSYAQNTDVSLANKVTTDTPAEQLNMQAFNLIGSAKFSVFFWDIYHSSLFSSTGHYPVKSNEKVLFKIDYLKDVSAESLIQRTIEQWQHLGFSEADYQHYLPQLTTLWPNITAGDNLALLIEKANSHFYFNGKYIGTISPSLSDTLETSEKNIKKSTAENGSKNTNVAEEQVISFGQLFIDIWLSPNTSQPKLRQQLLAGNKQVKGK